MPKIIIDYLDSKKSNITLPVGKDESLIYLLIGTKPGTKEVTVELKGPGAHAQILGLFLGREGESKMKTLQHHEAPNTKSNLLIRGVLYNNAKYSYEGLIRIDKKAQGSNAYQKNDNLLMSKKARVDTKPELEILANEVHCTHGATVGKIDEENLFYLTSRGISKTKAEQLIVEGFLKEVISRIPDAGIKQQLEQKIERELIK